MMMLGTQKPRPRAWPAGARARRALHSRGGSLSRAEPAWETRGSRLLPWPGCLEAYASPSMSIFRCSERARSNQPKKKHKQDTRERAEGSFLQIMQNLCQHTHSRAENSEQSICGCGGEVQTTQGINGRASSRQGRRSTRLCVGIRYGELGEERGRGAATEHFVPNATAENSGLAH